VRGQWRLLAAGLLCALLADWAGAATPELHSLSPPSAPRGVEISVQLLGRGFGEPIQWIVPFAAEIRASVHNPDIATFTIRPAPETIPGVYPVRVRTAEGASNLLLFGVGADLPQVAEAEPNSRVNEAQRVEWPVVITGSPMPHPDVDTFRFSVNAGEGLTFAAETRRLGLSADVAVQLLDPRGRILAYSDDTPGWGVDPRLDHAFTEPGEYFLQIHYSYFEYTGRNNLYRLKIGPFDYARAIYPLGGRRGERVELSVWGRDGQEARLEAVAPSDPWADDWLLPLPDYPASLPWRLAIGDLPEVLEQERDTGDAAGKAEAQAVDWPATINGVIALPEEVDRYRMAVEPGQKVRLTVAAQYLGSALDGILRVYDPAGKLLADNNDRSGRSGIDPTVDFTVPETVSEVTVALADCFGRGGIEHGYRLSIDHGGPDFEAIFGAYVQDLPYPPNDCLNLQIGQAVRHPVRVERRGYEGAIRLIAVDPPLGLSFEATEIAAGQTTGEIIVTATPDAPEPLFEIGFVGEGSADGQTVRRKLWRPIHLAEPGMPNLNWNWRLNRLVCCKTSAAKTESAE
jgi:hypothetical protein